MTTHPAPDIPSAGDGENPAFLTEQIITYLGNKRALLPFINCAVSDVQKAIGQRLLRTFDVFSGSGVVARFLKKSSSVLYANDLEAYSAVINRCYLANRSDIDMPELEDVHRRLVARIEATRHGGLVTELYAPRDEARIRPGERVFYTIRNANTIDTARQEIALLPERLQCFFLAPLLHAASVHANTAGIFKGFYKNKDHVGQFGGTARNALTRIMGDIQLPMPVFSNFDCETHVLRKDALAAAREMTEDVDLAYLDPPYNQHPYGSNYFMLNLILDYARPDKISPVSGIPAGWNRSPYNARLRAQQELFELILALRARYLLISYNSEGFVKYDDFVKFLSKQGELKTFSTTYNTFRACRNLKNRDAHVREFLFLLKKN